MDDQSHSLFDFSPMAETYDDWYGTDIGRRYDEEQKGLVSALLPPPVPNARLLDVGCGTGHWSRFFVEQGYGVLGLDVSPRMIEVARSRRMPGCHFEVGDACCLPTGNRIYQVVAAMSVLEFVTTPKTVVEGVARNIRYGGSMIIGSLNKLSPINRERVADGSSCYGAARMFSPPELHNLLRPFGRIRMRVTHDGSRAGSTFLHMLWDRGLLLCGKATGAYIVAEVQP